ncbi:LPXTG cell wall anchor domain-containing protein [Macrococcoides goetzii]
MILQRCRYYDDSVTPADDNDDADILPAYQEDDNDDADILPAYQEDDKDSLGNTKDSSKHAEILPDTGERSGTLLPGAFALLAGLGLLKKKKKDNDEGNEEV